MLCMSEKCNVAYNKFLKLLCCTVKEMMSEK